MVLEHILKKKQTPSLTITAPHTLKWQTSYDSSTSSSQQPVARQSLTQHEVARQQMMLQHQRRHRRRCCQLSMIDIFRFHNDFHFSLHLQDHLRFSMGNFEGKFSNSFIEDIVQKRIWIIQHFGAHHSLQVVSSKLFGFLCLVFIFSSQSARYC